MERFVRAFDPAPRIRVAPLWMMRLIGLFNAGMAFVAHLFARFARNEERFHAAGTWDLLGPPTTTLALFVERLRR